MTTLLTKTHIPQGDINRLSVYLRGWRALNELFQVEDLPNDLLEKLMTIEFRSNNRPDMLRRIVGRYGRNTVRDIHQKLNLHTRPKKARKP